MSIENPQNSGESPNTLYSADDILSTTTNSQIHKKPLQNAESMLKKGNIKSALEIYARVLQRIKEPEAHRKIKEIIEQISSSSNVNETLLQPKVLPSSRGDQKLNFTKVLRDLTDVVTHLSTTIKKQSETTEKNEVPPKEDFSPQSPAVDEKSSIPDQNETRTSSTPMVETREDAQRAPATQQIQENTAPRSEIPGYSPPPPAGVYNPPQQSQSAPSSNYNPGGQQPPQSIPSGGGTTPSIQTPNESSGFSPYPPQAPTVPPAEKPLEESVPLPPISNYNQPPQPSPAPGMEPESGLSKGILNRLQILEELYNKQDWQDLRNLPIKDRRSGGERRSKEVPVDDDRRKGEERREDDLLEKRDDLISEFKEGVDKGEIPSTLPKETKKPEPEKISEISSSLTDTGLPKINLPNPVILSYSGFQDAPKRNMTLEQGEIPNQPAQEGLKPKDVLFPTEKDAQVHEIFKINLPNPRDTSFKKRETEDDEEFQVDRDINIIDSPLSDEKYEEAMENRPDVSIPEIDTEAETREPEPERVMHGILELKPPEVDDAPFLTLTYDFSKIPHSFRLSKNYSVMEYSYYKYKHMLMKAQEFARRKMLKNALNYYRVVRSQNIPPELKIMINRNITDITEFLEKFVMSKGG